MVEKWMRCRTSIKRKQNHSKSSVKRRKSSCSQTTPPELSVDYPLSPKALRFEDVEVATVSTGHPSNFAQLPEDLSRSILTYLNHQDLTIFSTTCKSINSCVAEHIKNFSEFDFLDVYELSKLLVVLTTTWNNQRTSTFFPELLERWKFVILNKRGFPFWSAFPSINYTDASPILDSTQWNEPRCLRECRSRQQMLSRAKARCQKIYTFSSAVAGLQFALLKVDLETIMEYVRTLPLEPSSLDDSVISNGPKLLSELKEYFNHMFAPSRTPLTRPGSVTLDHCRILLLKVCRKILVRLRPTSQEMVNAVRLFRRQLTDCVRCYGLMPYAFEDPEVARGLVKLVRKSRLNFVDQCGNPSCNKPERAPQDHKRCSACMWVKYCSKSCQHADWLQHKEICQVLHNAIIYPFQQP
eukprot:NODE_2094_length_1691_cov_55.540179_g1790_i0.p1 GENE.NODE_2094_length_1691_cov_55.540179_g1790_i0~~NODE_2094_length_1691_cov_55.540179_g1790_i0.p1  ORF type:complete len:411 (+),score=31.71 NODE_2094_length_1691_cov_55.540179_g1790_i0:52-1284(+)